MRAFRSLVCCSSDHMEGSGFEEAGMPKSAKELRAPVGGVGSALSSPTNRSRLFVLGSGASGGSNYSCIIRE